jgi:hypothetical protein
MNEAQAQYVVSMFKEKELGRPPSTYEFNMMFAKVIGTVLLYLLLFFMYALSAAKLSYQRSGSGLFAFIAFILGPLYFPYYAFTQPTISTATMGAARKMLRHML